MSNITTLREAILVVRYSPLRRAAPIQSELPPWHSHSEDGQDRPLGFRVQTRLKSKTAACGQPIRSRSCMATSHGGKGEVLAEKLVLVSELLPQLDLRHQVQNAAGKCKSA